MQHPPPPPLSSPTHTRTHAHGRVSFHSLALCASPIYAAALTWLLAFPAAPRAPICLHFCHVNANTHSTQTTQHVPRPALRLAGGGPQFPEWALSAGVHDQHVGLPLRCARTQQHDPPVRGAHPRVAVMCPGMVCGWVWGYGCSAKRKEMIVCGFVR